ncbi:hypothetical protein PYW08_005361 [Mythimna loreyi]|uniref:Uncharacterized protein n=1 Tax=Mythimna loreyi TaxID=667449 RepID=A0ACC2QHE0_9NEOP|nr:hypothetical protein PYW08_005361 [Mythimna loreyi]
MTDGQKLSERKRKTPDCEWAQAIKDLTREFKSTLNEWKLDLEDGITKISDNVVSMKGDLASLTQVTSEIKNDINSLRADQFLLRQRVSELDEKHTSLTCQIDSLANSVQFVTDDHTDLSKKIDHCCKQVQETVGLNELVSDLVSKIDNLEQIARNCNIEICNIPERRNENLINLLINIGSAVKCNIQQNDIISIHRVSHAHQHNNKPKNIIVKFASRILRDNFLSAHRLCKGLTTEELGISGTSLPIYMHEHLTLKHKQLFREWREAAKKHNFKFIWVKHGTILVREKEGSKAIAIRNPQDIAKIKPYSDGI